jgi:hypothetical protein
MINFHRALIATAIVFCAGFAFWAGAAFQRGEGTVHLMLAMGFGLATLALAYYLKNLRRFLRP